MKIGEARAEIASSNIANADTPDYKARALTSSEFGDVYLGLVKHSDRHMSGAYSEDMGYGFRSNGEFRADNNSVNVAHEQQEIKESSQAYEFSLNTLRGKRSKLENILGEK